MESADLERFPLEGHLEELRRRQAAAIGIQGGPAYFEEDLQIFSRYAAESGILLGNAPGELTTAPSDEGNEHQVWFIESRASFLKATWPGFFGLKVIHRSDEDHRGNLILMDDGLLAPIDLRVQRLDGTLLDIVTRLAS